MAGVLGGYYGKDSEVCSGMDGANRFESFYSVGIPAKDFVPYSAVDNRDDHVTDAQFDSKLFLTRYGKEPSMPKRVVL